MKRAMFALVLVAIIGGATLGGMALADRPGGGSNEGNPVMSTSYGQLLANSGTSNQFQFELLEPGHFHLTVDLPTSWMDWDLYVLAYFRLVIPGYEFFQTVAPVTDNGGIRTYEFDGWGFRLRLTNHMTTGEVAEADYVYSVTYPR